jgi:hypothetical protein
MAGVKRKSASLLTKTQRRRIENGFAELDEAKRRRDEQRVRDRVQSGVADFRLLDDYPDEQFRMAFDDASETELTETLASAHLTLERVRDVHGVDRADVLGAARERADAASGEDLDSLDTLDLRTREEIRTEVAAETTEEVGPSRWLRWANTLMLLTAVGFWFAVLFWISDVAFGTEFLVGGPVQPVLFTLVVVGTVSWTLLVSVGIWRDEVFPRLVSFRSAPASHLQEVWTRWAPPALQSSVSRDEGDSEK